MSKPSIQITPRDASLDVARSIVLTGFAAGPVQVSAQQRKPDGSVWRSEATVVADSDGRIDLGRQAPTAGDWREADAMGLVWSMRRVQPATDPARTDEVEPLTTTVQARGADGATAQADFVQRYVVDGVNRRDVNVDGIVGSVFSPSSAGPHPVIVVMNGSGGGIPLHRAAQWAAHGYTAFALGYFKAPGLPDHISGTPLEYFERALRWVRAELAPRKGFVAITGQSRGGELSLLLGARFPELVDAVIAYVPSTVVHGTLRAGRPGEAPDSPVWTWQGKPLPNVWKDNPDADWSAFNQVPADGQPVRQAPAFLTVLRNADAVAAARIPVEKIKGPVLLISGTDDGFWPSSRYSDEIVDTLRASGHRWPYRHFKGEGAGHAIGLPNEPTTLIAKPHPVAGVVLTGGGTAQANAHANTDSWQAALDFLAEASA